MVALPQALLDGAILNSICQLLDAAVLDRAVDLAVAELTAGVADQRARKAEVDREGGGAGQD